MLLRDFDFEISTALNGRIALDILEKETFDIVFADVNMPEMSGFELLRELNNKNISVPFVFVSSESTPKFLKQAKEMGARGWVLKPVKSQELTNMVYSVFPKEA